MAHGMVCLLGPANTLLDSPEDGLRLVIGQVLGITTPFWRVRVFSSMDVDCSTTVALQAREWARVSFHLPGTCSQRRLDLGTVKIQVGIAVLGPALADGGA